MKPTITVRYTVEYVIDFATHYGFTKEGRCFNLKTGREIKQAYKDRSIGYYINRKFYTLTRLRKSLTRPKKNPCPF